jgi:hypothetical protein
MFMSCENFMEFISHHNHSSLPKNTEYHDMFYTLDRCATFPTNFFSLVTQLENSLVHVPI